MRRPACRSEATSSTSADRSYLTVTGRWINRWRACSIFARDSAVPHSSATELYPALAAMTRTSGPITTTGSTWLRCTPSRAPTFLNRSGQTFRTAARSRRRRVVTTRGVCWFPFRSGCSRLGRGRIHDRRRRWVRLETSAVVLGVCSGGSSRGAGPASSRLRRCRAPMAAEPLFQAANSRAASPAVRPVRRPKRRLPAGLGFSASAVRSGFLATGPLPDSSAASRSTSVPSVGQVFEPRDPDQRHLDQQPPVQTASHPGPALRKDLQCRQNRVDRPALRRCARLEAAAAVRPTGASTRHRRPAPRHHA